MSPEIETCGSSCSGTSGRAERYRQMRHVAPILRFVGHSALWAVLLTSGIAIVCWDHVVDRLDGIRR